MDLLVCFELRQFRILIYNIMALCCRRMAVVSGILAVMKFIGAYAWYLSLPKTP